MVGYPCFVTSVAFYTKSIISPSSPKNLQYQSVRPTKHAVAVCCSMRPYLEKLVKRENLTSQETSDAIEYSVAGEASDAEIAALLSLLAAKGETAEEITGVVASLRGRMIPVNVDMPVVDIVGTGGDGANTVNISTAASIVAAAAGCRVGKHGNRSVSSKSGSADVLQALGVQLSLTPEGVSQCIHEVGIGFMFAPNHHPSLRRIGPIRKAMKIRTVFNIVGPFLNPCSAEYGVIGVFRPELLNVAADVLIASGTKRAVVVHTDGLDEYSNTGVSQVVEVHEGVKKAYSFDAEESLGMRRATIADLRGGEAKENASIIRDVLSGNRNDAITDAIALNAAASCWVYGLDCSMDDSLSRVREILASGTALQTLEKWIHVSQEAGKVFV